MIKLKRHCLWQSSENYTVLTLSTIIKKFSQIITADADYISKTIYISFVMYISFTIIASIFQEVCGSVEKPMIIKICRTKIYMIHIIYVLKSNKYCLFYLTPK